MAPNDTPVYPRIEQQMRTFDTGATRDSDTEKWDYEGFLSPRTLHRYAKYMHKHRKQSDGKMRASDNWQKGIPLAAYIKSLWRHLVDLWTIHRTKETSTKYVSVMEDALCAIIFNASGYLHELLKAKEAKQQAYAEDSEAQRICPNDPYNPCGKNYLGPNNEEDIIQETERKAREHASN